MTTFFSTFKQIGFFTIALTLALVANFAYGQWTNPTEEPTGGNAEVPVNVSGVSQAKGGDLGADEFFASNKMRSELYCDFITGTKCFTAQEVRDLADGGSNGSLPQLYECPQTDGGSTMYTSCATSCVGQVSTSNTCVSRRSNNDDNGRCTVETRTCTAI